MDAIHERHVLIVDDDDSMRMLLAYYFNSRNMKVTEAADGNQAIELALFHEFDLITMDILMPHTTGIDAIRAIRTVSPSQQIIIVSSCKEDKYYKAARELKINHYLSKPLNLDALTQAVDDEMGHKIPPVDPWNIELQALFSLD